MRSYDDSMPLINEAISNNVSNEDERLRLEKIMLRLREYQANIMIVGGTGVGKFSAINNAPFDTMEKGNIGRIRGVVSGAMTGAAVGAKIAASLGLPPVAGTIVGGLCGLFS